MAFKDGGARLRTVLLRDGKPDDLLDGGETEELCIREAEANTLRPYPGTRHGHGRAVENRTKPCLALPEGFDHLVAVRDVAVQAEHAQGRAVLFPQNHGLWP